MNTQINKLMQKSDIAIYLSLELYIKPIGLSQSGSQYHLSMIVPKRFRI